MHGTVLAKEKVMNKKNVQSTENRYLKKIFDNMLRTGIVVIVITITFITPEHAKAAGSNPILWDQECLRKLNLLKEQCEKKSQDIVNQKYNCNIGTLHEKKACVRLRNNYYLILKSECKKERERKKNECIKN